jgi:processing peptidase subunit beta
LAHLSVAAQKLQVASPSPTQALSFQNYPSAQVTTLPNGMRVVTEASGASSEAVSVGVFIDSGSRYESLENNGVAHFLEHLTFKGTRKRSQYDLEIEVENMGGHLNAFTSREHTFYYSRVLRKDMRRGLEIIADILQNSVLDRNAIERERDVILRESEEVAKINEEVVFDNLHLAAFPDHGLGYTILGSDSNILKINRSQLQDYIATHYIGPRLVVVAAGAVTHSEAVAMANELFSRVPAVGKVPVTRTPPKFVPREARQLVEDDPRVDSANFAVAFEAPSWQDPDAVPFMVLQSLMGSWDGSSAAGTDSHSAVVREISSSLLARSFSTFHSAYADAGLFGCYASCEPSKAGAVLKLIGQELGNLGTDGYITEDALELAKTQIKINLMAALDTTSMVAEEIGRQVLVYGRRLHPMEMAHRVEAVDAAAVVNCVRKYVRHRPHALSAYGCIREFPDEVTVAKLLLPATQPESAAKML